MKHQTDNIELRSQKVRNIIGEIPPFIIRLGITIFTIIFAMIIIGSYYFEFPRTIEVGGTLTKADNKIMFSLNVPSNQLPKVFPDQKITFNTEKLSLSEPLKIESSVQVIDSNSYVSNEGVFFKINGSIYSNELILEEQVIIEASIYTDTINVFDWCFGK